MSVLPSGVETGVKYSVKLGSSFHEDTQTYHTIRYDFKPASLTQGDSGTLTIEDTGQIAVTYTDAENQEKSLFRGNQKSVHKECVLAFNPELKEFTLERVVGTVQVKRARAGRRNGAPSRPAALPAGMNFKQAKTAKKKQVKARKAKKVSEEKSANNGNIVSSIDTATAAATTTTTTTTTTALTAAVANDIAVEPAAATKGTNATITVTSKKTSSRKHKATAEPEMEATKEAKRVKVSQSEVVTAEQPVAANPDVGLPIAPAPAQFSHQDSSSSGSASTSSSSSSGSEDERDEEASVSSAVGFRTRHRDVDPITSENKPLNKLTRRDSARWGKIDEQVETLLDDMYMSPSDSESD